MGPALANLGRLRYDDRPAPPSDRDMNGRTRLATQAGVRNDRMATSNPVEERINLLDEILELEPRRVSGLASTTMPTILLLLGSNVFMTFAWYRHLRHQQGSPLWVAILTSWGIAFFEYCLAVPANRIGYGRFNLPQLKVIQEVVSLVIFASVAVVAFHVRLRWNHAAAAMCLVLATYFVFRE